MKAHQKVNPEFTSFLAPLFLRRVREAGREIGPVLCRFGLPSEAADVHTLPLQMSTFHELQDELAGLIGEADFGLRTALWLPRGSYRLIEFAARSAATLGEALRTFFSYFGLPGEPIEFELVERGPAMLLTQTVRSVPVALGRHGNEFTVASILRAMHDISGDFVLPREVWLAHPRRERYDVATAFKAPHVRYATGRNALLLDRGVLDRKLVTADPALHATLRGIAEATGARRLASGGLSEQVREVLRAALSGRRHDIDFIAAKFHVSPRTLQRRLAKEGTVFAQLVDDVRLSMARVLLEDPHMSLSKVATCLGYGNPGAFSRAYRRWTGAPPRTPRSRVLERRAFVSRSAAFCGSLIWLHSPCARHRRKRIPL